MTWRRKTTDEALEFTADCQFSSNPSKLAISAGINRNYYSLGGLTEYVSPNSDLDA